MLPHIYQSLSAAVTGHTFQYRAKDLFPPRRRHRPLSEPIFVGSLADAIVAVLA